MPCHKTLAHPRRCPNFPIAAATSTGSFVAVQVKTKTPKGLVADYDSHKRRRKAVMSSYNVNNANPEH